MGCREGLGIELLFMERGVQDEYAVVQYACTACCECFHFILLVQANPTCFPEGCREGLGSESLFMKIWGTG